MYLDATRASYEVESVTFWTRGIVPAKTQRRKENLSLPLRLCVFAGTIPQLFIAHRGSHRRDNRVSYSSLKKLLYLPGREIKLDWRFFDSLDDRPFRKSSVHEPDHTFVRQCRFLLDVRRGALPAFSPRREAAHAGRT